MNIPLFGPAGDSESFTAAGLSKLAVPGWLRERGLTAYEYQCGRGVQVNPVAAAAFKAEAAANGVEVSLHAPYYISLASADPAKRDNSVNYILQSAEAVRWLGGSRIVVHPGGLGGLTREEAAAIAAETLQKARRALDEAGYGDILICPETMGKINQLGDLGEVIGFCKPDERFYPCIDFGHLNSRTGGGMNSREAFAAVLDQIHNELGEERGRRFHIHFSKIEYTAGGEKKHLTFEDAEYGPEPGPLMTLIAERGLAPTVICESDGTQAEDAAVMRDMWQKHIKQHSI